MPIREVLMLAVTRMHGGVCIAGMTAEPDPVTGLRWVRPAREFRHVLLGDITTTEGRVLGPFDVVELQCKDPCPDPPHTEDCVVDFVRRRPRVVRRLEGEPRAQFLEKYQDPAPRQVLDNQQRSLCLVKPDSVTGCYRLDGYSGKFQARMSFRIMGRSYRGAHASSGSYAKGGFSVTDLRWRALGRQWLPEEGGWTEFDEGDLQARLGVGEIYLALGLTRPYEGRCWPIVIGVHTVPDYEVVVDYDNL